MSASAASSPKSKVAFADPFVAMVVAATRRAARKVAAENKRLGLSLIVSDAKRRKPAAKRKPPAAE